MAETSAFPVFIRAEYDARGNAFRAFEKDATTAADGVRRRFEATFDEINQVISKALSRGLGSGGRIDLDTGAMRQAVADAKLAEAAFDDLTRTATRLAAETGDTSQATRHYIQALSAQRIEAAQVLSQREAELATHSRLQAALDATADRQSKLAAAYRETFAEAARAAQAEVSQNAANSRIGGTIAPAMNSRAIDNGAGYQELARAAQAADQYSAELAELRQQLDPLAAEQARVNQQMAFAAEALKRGDITAEQFQARSSQLRASLDDVQSGGRGASAAMSNLGFQIQDVFQGLALGTNPFVILAQQGGQIAAAFQQLSDATAPLPGQLGSAASSMTGLNTATTSTKASTIQLGAADVAAVPAMTGLSAAASVQSTKIAGVTISMRGATAATTELTLAQRIGAFAAGPFGAGLIAVVSVLGMMAWNLRKTTDEVHTLTMASDGLSSAQGALGEMFDLTTGKIKAQNEMLRLNIQLMAIQLRAEASAAETTVMDAQKNSGQYSWGSWFSGGPSGRPGSLTQVHDTVARRRLQGVMTGKQDPSEVAKWAASADFSGLDISREEYLDALARVIEVRAKNATADAIDKSLEDGVLDSALRRSGTPKKERKGGGDSGKAAEALADAMSEANEKAIALRGQFDRMPSDIDRANNALIDADQIITEMNNRLADGKLSESQRKFAAETKKIAEEAKALAAAAPNLPMAKGLDDLRQTVTEQQLLLEGRMDEADALRDQLELARLIGAENLAQIPVLIHRREITRGQLETFFEQQQALRDQTRLMERLDRAGLSVRARLDEVRTSYETIQRGIAGLPSDARGALKGVFLDLRAQFNDLFARRMTDKLFGNFFQQIEDEIRSKRPIDIATDNFVQNTGEASTAARDLAENLHALSQAVSGSAANDNSPSGPLSLGGGIANEMSSLFTASVRELVVTAPRMIKRASEQANGKDAPLTKTMDKIAKLMEGGFYGQSAGSLAFGQKNSAVGSFIGGAIGEKLGEKFLSKGLESISKGLGEFAGPLGAIAGGLLGGALGKLIGGTKKGSATIGGTGSDLTVASYSGNSNKFKQAAGTSADSAIATINRIAEMLGADVNAGAGSVSIGIRDGKYRVDTSGRGITKVKKGAIDFGEDAEAAIRAATMDLIKDGVLTGLKASTLNLLKQGKDLEAALDKALDFESVFTRLKEYKDPVGAALDGLDKEFTKLQKIFKEAGASTEEYAQLEELYGIERAKAIKEAGERLTASLKSLYDDLVIGDNGKSLRDRLAAAQAAYDPLKARVAAGDRTAYDDFAQAAQALLDIQRQFSGSQNGYFDLLDEITALTKQRIDAETNIASIAANRDSPFTSTGQVATDSTAVVGAIGQTNQILIDGFRALIAANSNGAALPTGFLTQRFGSA